MKVSFDFDGTLEHKQMQDLAKKMVEAGHTVWITSSRMFTGSSTRKVNNDLFKVAEDLGIPNNVQLTNNQYKHEYLKEFDMHIDNDMHEVTMINSYPIGCMAVYYSHIHINTQL